MIDLVVQNLKIFGDYMSGKKQFYNFTDWWNHYLKTNDGKRKFDEKVISMVAQDTWRAALDAMENFQASHNSESAPLCETTSCCAYNNHHCRPNKNCHWRT